jgi:hypothetical protein
MPLAAPPLNATRSASARPFLAALVVLALALVDTDNPKEVYASIQELLEGAYIKEEFREF